MSMLHQATNATSTFPWRAGGRLLALATGLLITLLLLVQHSRAAAPDGFYAAPDALGGLAGTVYRRAATPLPGTEVTLWRLVDGVRTERYAVTTTDNGGAYQFVGIPSGTYYLTFYVPHQCYVEQWYAQGTKRAEADALIVNGNLRTNLNVTLTTGACITGVIRLDGEIPAREGLVTIYNEDNGWQIIDYTSIDANGRYYSHALPPDIYRLCAQTDHPRFERCYGGYYPSEATDITVTTATTLTQIDLVMAPGYFDGVISGTVTAYGTPQTAIDVYLYQGRYGLLEQLLYVTTDSAGRFAFAGLPPNAYSLGIRDPAGVLATTFYTGQIHLEMATRVDLQHGETISNVNVTTVAGGTLHGKAPYQFLAIESSYIFLYWQPSQPRDLPYWRWSGYTANTDSEDEFTFDSLPAGKYRIGFGIACFRYNNDCAYQEYYGGGTDFASAWDIVVESGKITNIDATQDSVPKQFLPIIQR